MLTFRLLLYFEKMPVKCQILLMKHAYAFIWFSVAQRQHDSIED